MDLHFLASDRHIAEDILNAFGTLRLASCKESSLLSAVWCYVSAKRLTVVMLTVRLVTLGVTASLRLCGFQMSCWHCHF